LGISPTCPSCNIPPSTEDDENNFKWEFMILVEDSEGDTLPIIIAEEEAEELLSLPPEKYPLPVLH
jgi:hypothetical protein